MKERTTCAYLDVATAHHLARNRLPNFAKRTTHVGQDDAVRTGLRRDTVRPSNRVSSGATLGQAPLATHNHGPPCAGHFGLRAGR